MVWKLLLALALLSATTLAQNCQPGSACFNFYMPSNCHFAQFLYQSSVQQPPFGDPNLGFVTWKENLSPGESGERQGVLTVGLATGATGVRIYLGIFKPSNYSFNIGNSENNNGGGYEALGDTLAAEIHNIDEQLYIWERYAGDIPITVAQQLFPTYFTTGTPTRFDVDIKKSNDLQASVHPDIPQANMQFTNDQLFDLNFSVYVGLNRVIANSLRYGTGIYEVCVQFY